MLTNDALDRLENELAEIFDTYPYATQFEGEHYRELVKMARRYAWLRDESIAAPSDTPTVIAASNGWGKDTLMEGEELDTAIDSAIDSQRKEGGEG